MISCKNLLKEYTGCKNILLTRRGNASIFLLFFALKKKYNNLIMLIPKEGGWITYKQYLDKLKINYEYYLTDYSKIDINALKEQIEAKKEQNKFILVTEPGGYFANQPLVQINKLRKQGTRVILDVSGSIGKDYIKEKADFYLGSFGKGKPVNLGYGGFIGSNTDLTELIAEKYENRKFDNIYLEPLCQKLKEINYSKYKKIREQILSELQEKKILYPEDDAINLVVLFKDEKEKQELINYCETHNFEYTICPREIRVNTNAISIEIKRK